MKVFPLVGYLAMTLGYLLRCLLAPVAPTLLSGKCLLCFCYLLFGFAKIARVIVKLAVGERDKVRHS